MDIKSALASVGAKGLAIGPVRVIDAKPRENRTGQYGDYVSQMAHVEDSTGKATVFLSDNADLVPLIGKIVDLGNVTVKAGKGDFPPAFNLNNKGVVKEVGAVDRAPEAILGGKVVPSAPAGAMYITPISPVSGMGAPGTQASAMHWAGVYAECWKAFEERTGIKLPPLSDCSDKESFEEVRAAWTIHAPAITAIFIKVGGR